MRIGLLEIQSLLTTGFIALFGLLIAFAQTGKRKSHIFKHVNIIGRLIVAIILSLPFVVVLALVLTNRLR